MNPRTIRLLCVCFALVFSLVTRAAPSSEKPEYSAWKKRVLDAIGTRWYREVQKHEALVAVGKTRILFQVLPDGRIRNLKVISNSSNEAFAHICITAIGDGKYPPIPATVLKDQPHKWCDMDVSFEMFSR
jgi:hypothetical protein